MSEPIDPKLVELITEEVIKALGAPASSPGRTAPIRPPAGVCTGDYSQFTERPDLRGAGSAAPTAQPAASRVLTGVVTAQQLTEALNSTAIGTVQLAHDTRLTPLANDFVREHPGKITRIAPNNPGGAPNVRTGWLWWADGHCNSVQNANREFAPALAASGAPRTEAGLVQVIQDICSGLRDRSITGGLLFVSSAARATVLANRCPLIRAVVGTCPDAVEQAIAQIGPNTLIVEYPYVDGQALQAMVRRMTEYQPNVPAHVQRELAEMQRNGA